MLTSDMVATRYQSFRSCFDASPFIFDPTARLTWKGGDTITETARTKVWRQVREEVTFVCTTYRRKDPSELLYGLVPALLYYDPRCKLAGGNTPLHLLHKYRPDDIMLLAEMCEIGLNPMEQNDAGETITAKMDPELVAQLVDRYCQRNACGSRLYQGGEEAWLDNAEGHLGRDPRSARQDPDQRWRGALCRAQEAWLRSQA